MLPYRSKNQYLCVCVSRIRAHTVHPIAMKLSQVDVKHTRGGFENLKNLKIALAGVPGVALSLQEHTPFIRLQ